MKGLKRRSSSGLNSNSYRVPTKQRGVDDSDSDTVSVASEDSGKRPPRMRRMVTRKNSSGNEKPSMPNRQSTMGGVVTAFLALRSRTIVKETIEEEPPPPPPRKMLSAKRRLVKKSSSTGDIYPSAAVSLRRKFSESRAATALY
ncbi:uncharacterized protein LOC123529447 [Mercenaria mercenaria]|uniref:uncharacterized protein LOC123529447 n=1 Tax=Mercenaria mercenaria TaxID=6596 RepID=UPI00234F51D8|nr:uncharacterized protein LOC123529447 [Mercenaria mercenaria]